MASNPLRVKLNDSSQGNDGRCPLTDNIHNVGVTNKATFVSFQVFEFFLNGPAGST